MAPIFPVSILNQRIIKGTSALEWKSEVNHSNFLFDMNISSTRAVFFSTLLNTTATLLKLRSKITALEQGSANYS